MAALLLSAACGPARGPAGEALAPSPECRVVSGFPAAGVDADSSTTVVLGLAGAVNPSFAPRPGNDAEAVLFRQLYETLVRVDCAGREYPALARDWFASDGGRRWTLTLRDGERFWDGAPVTAGDVVASWNSRGVVLRTVATVESVTVVDERTLSVTFPLPERRIPRVLADPVLAVTRSVPGISWPIGTGRYRPAAFAAPAEAGALVLVPADLAAPPQTRIEVRIQSGADARDLLDAGVDLLITRDPGTLDYAAAASGVRSLPLPWDRTYAVLVPAATDGSFTSGGVSAGLRDALARDVMRVEARASEPPHWWVESVSCHILLPQHSARRETDARAPRIVYEAGDDDARSLAERLVALALDGSVRLEPSTAAGRAPPAAVGLTANDLGRSLRRGGDLGYVMRLPRRVMDACMELSALISRAPWLGSQTGLRQAVVPLVDTRARALIRRDRVDLGVDWDGTVTILRP